MPKFEYAGTFGEALEHAKQGKLIFRSAYPHALIFMRPSDELSVDMVVNKVKSLPQSIKNLIAKKIKTGELNSESTIEFSAYLCMIVGKYIQNGYMPTQEDLLANDWNIYNV